MQFLLLFAESTCGRAKQVCQSSLLYAPPHWTSHCQQTSVCGLSVPFLRTMRVSSSFPFCKDKKHRIRNCFLIPCFGKNGFPCFYVFVLSVIQADLFFQCSLNQPHEQWMRSGWAGLEFRMCLGGFEVRMILEFDNFYQAVVRAGA